MIRKIAFTASSWKEYESQGPAYKDLSEWWQKNYNLVPGDWSANYYSWTKWYNENRNKNWSGIHKGPEEVLTILEETAKPTPHGFFGDVNNKKDRMNFIEWINEKFKRKKSPEPVAPVEPALSSGKVLLSHSGINVTNITEDTKTFIDVLGATAENLGAPKPVITSGYRTPKSQAKVMANNWTAHGGLNGGREYLINLYSDDVMAKAIDDIFRQYGTGQQALDLAEKYIIERGVHLGAHIRNPGIALDLRMTGQIEEVLEEIRNSGKFNLKILNEGDHFHVEVRGVNVKVANKQISFRIRK